MKYDFPSGIQIHIRILNKMNIWFFAQKGFVNFGVERQCAEKSPLSTGFRIHKYLRLGVDPPWIQRANLYFKTAEPCPIIG